MATITQAITDDHRHIQDCYNEVVNSSDPDHQQRWGNQFTWELARHSVGEELILYPAFEWHMGTKMLKDFQSMSSSDPDYIPRIKELWCKLEDHIKDEEGYDLPALEEKLTPEHSESMAKSFGRTKHFVPSRSHPLAGEHPPFESVVGLLTAPIDRLTDLFRKFPEKGEEAKPSGPRIDIPPGSNGCLFPTPFISTWLDWNRGVKSAWNLYMSRQEKTEILFPLKELLSCLAFPKTVPYPSYLWSSLTSPRTVGASCMSKIETESACLLTVSLAYLGMMAPAR
ncbi:uncharacterized protein PODANS_7_1050 [Podospora anserina S mat+]|uniref:Podospora anserina S mat+ genomic DNA chromosome 7, supercontig 3 n=1 Tax=Podospora anserina (strain S / ATCC MYA-4624 / DSM 980 / FGSC 10383) TaxID=515849 RepID=B2ANY2_PODAN|nr:uncharacterized protein PODANS_7_1050 [Podospora anserina S mat+]CAP65686.1 unnamed protein product [Podospora anserina S mat+]